MRILPLVLLLATMTGAQDKEPAGDFYLPLENWDLYSLAAALEGDPSKIHAFVEEEIAWIPYPGVLRGAEGALASREGNDLDRGLLLAELLRLSGKEVRFARATLDEESAKKRVSALFTDRPSRSLFERHGLRSPDPVRGLPETEELEAWRRQIDDEVERVRGFIASGLTEVDGTSEAVREARDHWWVQLKAGDGWTDLDSGPAPEAVSLHTEIPEEMFQWAEFEVFVETRASGTLKEERVLQILVPVEILLAEGAVVLHGQRGGAAGLEAALLGSQIRPLLVVGPDVFVGDPFAYRHEEVKRGGLPRGGLGGLDVLGGKPATTGERLVITLKAPGKPDIKVERSLFDRLGPAARAGETPGTAPLLEIERRDGFPLAIRQTHYFGFSAGLLDVEDYIEHARAAVELALEETREPGDGFEGAVWTARLLGETALLLGQAHRLGLDSADVRLYEAIPRITTVSTLAAAVKEEIHLDVTIDLTFDRLRALARKGTAAPAIFERKLRFGVGQGFLEDRITEMIFQPYDARNLQAFSMPAAIEKSREKGIPWTLEDGEHAPDAAALLRKTRMAGRTALAPARGLDIKELPTLFWWDLDPSTGDVVAVADTSRNQGRRRGQGGYGPDYRRYYNHFKKHKTREQARNSIPGDAFEDSPHRPGQNRHWHNQSHNRGRYQSGRGNVHAQWGKKRPSTPPGFRERQKYRKPKGERRGGGNEYMMVLANVAVPSALAVLEEYPWRHEDAVAAVAAEVAIQLLP